MWTRTALKTSAKEHLQARYWYAFLVTIIVSALGGGSSVFTWRFDASDFQMSNFDWESFASGDWQGFLDHFDWELGGRLIAAAVLAGLLALIIGIAYSIFISPLAQVGGNRWFSRNRESASRPLVGQVFSLFKAASYLKVVVSMLWMNFFLFLWGLLSLIPAAVGWILSADEFAGLMDLTGSFNFTDDIFPLLQRIAPIFAITLSLSALMSIPLYIKMYSYKMTPWILADNPAIGYRRALKLSMDLTRGHKWQIFILDLSFIGWFILGVMACGIGTLFVAPYYQAVQAELFAALRQTGVERGLSTMEEFGFSRVDQA